LLSLVVAFEVSPPQEAQHSMAATKVFGGLRRRRSLISSGLGGSDNPGIKAVFGINNAEIRGKLANTIRVEKESR
jgi:hypothetical protein